MRVLYSVLCEEAAARQDGRIDLHGVFHQLYAPGFPAKQDRMVLALAVEWNDGEEGVHEFKIDLNDPNRSPSLTINGETEVQRGPEVQGPPQTRLILPLEEIVFPAPGTYLFELETGGDRIPLAPLHLIENPDEQ